MRDELATRRDAIMAARAFGEAHAAIDSAIGTFAQLVARIIEARQRHLSGVAGQPELTQVMAISTLTMRAQIIDAHVAVEELGRLIGLKVTGEGGFGPKPPNIDAKSKQVAERQAA